MTTYTLQGFAVQYGANDEPTAIGTSQLTFTTFGTDPASFSYGIDVEYGDALPDVLLNTSAVHRVQVESSFDEGWTRVSEDPYWSLYYEIGTLYLNDGRRTEIFQITNTSTDRQDIFILGGDLFTLPTTVSQAVALSARVTGATTTSGAFGFGPGETIPVSSLPFLTVTENDHLALMEDISDPVTAGPGDDLIEVFSDLADVSGGDGTDTVRFFGFNLYEATPTFHPDGIHIQYQTWGDYLIRSDVETIEFARQETYSYAELAALIPVEPVELTGDETADLLTGDEGDDTLTGMDGDDTLHGLGSDDSLFGGAGNDILYGGAGDDILNAGSGANILRGGDGLDHIALTAASQFGSGLVARNVSSATQTGTGVSLSVEGLNRFLDVIDGGEGTADALWLTDTADAFFLHDAISEFHAEVALTEDSDDRPSIARLAGVEAILGYGGDDIIDLTSQDYSLSGSHLQIAAGQGNDVVWGSDADEYISGQNGDDTLFSGAGEDTLSGGNGADLFEFTVTSTEAYIRDFDPDEGDRLAFYNSDDAVFDASSLALSGDGIDIGYTTSRGAGTLHVRMLALNSSDTLDLTAIEGALIVL